MGIVLGVLIAILIIGAIGLAAWGVYKRKKQLSISGGILCVVLLIMFVFVPFGFIQIETGEVAVIKVWGEVKGTKSAGLHFVNALTTKCVIYDMKTQQLDISTEVYTKDAQPLRVELTVQFSVNVDFLINIATVYGDLDTLKTRIEKITIEKAKVVLAAQSAMQIIETRDLLSPKVLTEVKTLETQYFIIVENVVIVDMAFNEAFESAVEQKMIAEQEKLKADYDKEKAIIKAEEELEVAKLNAQAEIAKAKGKADAEVEIAKGEAMALKLKSIEVARMLGFEIKETQIKDENGIVVETLYEIITAGKSADELKLISDYIKYIAYLEAWDGKLPTVITGDDGSLLIPIPTT